MMQRIPISNRFLRDAMREVPKAITLYDAQADQTVSYLFCLLPDYS